MKRIPKEREQHLQKPSRQILRLLLLTYTAPMYQILLWNLLQILKKQKHIWKEPAIGKKCITISPIHSRQAITTSGWRSHKKLRAHILMLREHKLISVVCIPSETNSADQESASKKLCSSIPNGRLIM